MTCRCTLHPRKPHVDPCRACSKNHAPSALGRTALSGSGAPEFPSRSSRIHGTRADNESRPPERVGRS